MQIGFIGLGKMGLNMVFNLKDHNHDVVAYNRSAGPVQEIIKQGVNGVFTIEELMHKLPTRKVVWIMVKAGSAVDMIVEQLLPYLEQGDVRSDGGNTQYQDTQRRYAKLKEKGIVLVDVGTSGGIEGARKGACMMIGGDKEIFQELEPVFKDMCVANGYGYCGQSGAGHYVKMVHNGIEYGMMQSMAEGFELLEKSDFKLDLAKVARIWEHGSVIRSWLIELVRKALEKDCDLNEFKGPIQESGEGRWAVAEGAARGMALPVISAALKERDRSQHKQVFADRVVSALREGFGRHILGDKK